MFAITKNPWFDRIALISATGLGVGYSPLAPGTVGSLLGLGVAIICPPLIAIALLFPLGVWASQRSGKIFGVVDSGKIVIDEIVGILITLVGAPLTADWLVSGFLLFRFFDIVKIPPSDLLDRHLKNGWGVMLDDVMAGIYGNVVLHFMMRASV